MIEYITKQTFTSFWSQIFRDEKVKIFSNLFKKPLEIPWMRSRELDLMVDLLTNLQPKKCLEWGAGYSSAYFSKLFKQDFKWISIEHDKKWAEYAQSKITQANISVHYVAANNLEHHAGIDDGSIQDYEDYVNYPEQFGKFDFIFIDGRARNECLKKAKLMLEDNGVIVIHDANRQEYLDECSTISNGTYFLDWRSRSGGFCIFTGSSIQLNDLIDVDHYDKLFKIYNSVGKRIKV